MLAPRVVIVANIIALAFPGILSVSAYRAIVRYEECFARGCPLGMYLLFSKEFPEMAVIAPVYIPASQVLLPNTEAYLSQWHP